MAILPPWSRKTRSNGGVPLPPPPPSTIAPPPMALPCQRCGTAPGIIYCQADVIRLCILCDDALHAADEVSLTHARAPVCDHCHAQAAVVRYLHNHLTLCASCDCLRGSCRGIPAPRQPVRSYTGFSWEQMWVSLLGTPDDTPIQLPSPEEVGLGNALETADNHYDPSESFAAWEDPPSDGMGGVMGDLEHSFETSIDYMVSSSSSMLPTPDSSTDVPPLPRDLAPELNCPEASTPVQNCFNFQSANNLHPCINNSSVQPTLPQLNLTRGSSLFDTWSHELSVLFTSESNWGLNVMPEQTNARQEAVQRYREKRNSRSFRDQIKYPLRKARAHARKRVKGRFVKDGETCTDDSTPTPPGETPEPDQTHH